MENEVCKFCGGRLHVVKDGKVVRCSECFERVMMAHNIVDAGIPPEFVNSDLRNLHASSDKQKIAGQVVKRMIENMGVGKLPTKSIVLISDDYKPRYLLASMFLVSAIRCGKQVRMVSLQQIIDIAFGRNDDISNLSFFDSFDILCIDIGLELKSQATSHHILSMYYSRLARGKYTFFVSIMQKFEVVYNAEVNKLFNDKNKFLILDVS